MPTRVEESHAFLSALFEHKPDKGYVQLWHKERKASHYFTSLKVAADNATALRDDVYVCAGLAIKNHGKTKRATREQIGAIPGVWLDIDVNGGPENKTGAAESLDDAHALATARLEPTLIVHSGYGLQAWWLFDEPWVFGSKDERENAAALVAGFQQTHRDEAKARDIFKLDSTHDLARLMRVPGTFNRKGGLEAPVVGYGEPITEQDGPRYTIDVLREHTASVTMNGLTLASTRDVSIGMEGDAQPPADKLTALLENSDAFKRTWDKTRKDDTTKSWSQSEWDLSIASQAVYVEWSDQEIANLLIAYRRKHGQDVKNEQYYEKTIARAHKRRDVDAERDQRAQQRAEAIDELQQIEQSQNGVPDNDHVCAVFSKAVGGPPVKEVVQSNRDVKAAVLRLVLADGTEVPVGGMTDFLNADRFREKFATVTAYVMPPIKRQDWYSATGALLKARVLRDADVTTTISEVRSWLRAYMELLTPDHNEAATRRDPFEKDECVWIAPRAFADYVNRHLRRRTTVAEVEETLSQLGFERKLKSYQDVERDRRTTTKDYYCAPKVVIEDAD